MSIRVFEALKVKEGINIHLAIGDFVKKFEKAFLKFLWQHHNLKINDSDKRLQDIEDYYREETSSKIRGTSHANLDLLVYTVEDKTVYLPILYGEIKKVYLENKKSLLEKFDDYSYWNTTEKPENIKEEEWEERKEFYFEAFYGTDSNSGGDEDYRITIFKAENIYTKLQRYRWELPIQDVATTNNTDN